MGIHLAFDALLDLDNLARDILMYRPAPDDRSLDHRRVRVDVHTQLGDLDLESGMNIGGGVDGDGGMRVGVLERAEG